MPALKEKSLALLGVQASADMHTSAGVTIFTVPPGKYAHINQIVVYNPSASLAAATAVNFGSFFNGGTNSNSLTAVTAISQHWTFNASGIGARASAGQVFQCIPASGAAASASIAVFGFLDSA